MLARKGLYAVRYVLIKLNTGALERKARTSILEFRLVLFTYRPRLSVRSIAAGPNARYWSFL